MAYVDARIIVSEPTEEFTECPLCGLDSLARFPLTYITEHGVGPFGVAVRCLRCDAPGGDD